MNKPFTPDTEAVYRYDLKVTVNGEVFNGVGVAKGGPVYKFEIEPPGKIDRITWRTCHRDGDIYKPKMDWNGTFKFTITLVQGIEDRNNCGIEITVLEEKKRRNAFAYIAFEDTQPHMILIANSMCNGGFEQNKGTSICQSAVDLVQLIEFGAPVETSDKLQDGCKEMIRVSDRKFMYYVSKGNCLYSFASEGMVNGKHYTHRLSTRGYTDVPPIEVIK